MEKLRILHLIALMSTTRSTSSSCFLNAQTMSKTIVSIRGAFISLMRQKQRRTLKARLCDLLSAIVSKTGETESTAQFVKMAVRILLQPCPLIEELWWMDGNKVNSMIARKHAVWKDYQIAIIPIALLMVPLQALMHNRKKLWNVSEHP